MDITKENIESVTKTQEIQKHISTDLALDLLKSGNARFIESHMTSRNLGEQVSTTAGGQYPFAAVLSCIDSRVPAEIVFDQGIGDIFSVRIAGNFVNEDILGSLEFAAKIAGVKAIVVMGHSSCGAVKGACDNVQLGNLTGMLEKIKPAVDAVDNVEGERNSSNAAFVQSVADMNVKLTIDTLLDKSEVLKEMYDNGEITVVGAMYDVKSGKVTFS